MTPDELARALAADEPEARRIATKHLATLRAKDAGALLVRALGDDDWRVRKEAALVAPQMEPRTSIIDALCGALHDVVNIGLRNGAVEALAGIGQDAIPRVIEEIARLDADGRKLAAEVLGGVPDPRGARALCALLRDDDVNVRAASAEALGRAGASGDEARELATEALTKVLKSGEKFVVMAALDALGKLEARLAWKVVEPLAEAPLSRRAALAVGANSDEPDATVALAAAVNDASKAVARDAVVLLGERLAGALGDDQVVERARAALNLSPEALERLRGWTTEEDTRVRGAALTALGLARHEDDVPRLLDALGDDAVAERAEIGLRLFGEDVVKPLLAAGRTAAPIAQGASISMMPMLATPREVKAELRDALRSPSPDVVAGALKALAVAGEEAEISLILPFARVPDAKVANAALSSLFAIASRLPERAGEVRAKIDPTGPDAAAGCVLIDARARSGHGADEADVAFLTTSLARGRALARRAALEALATIGGERAATATMFALADEEREVVLAAVRAHGRLKRPEPLERFVASTDDPVLVAAALRALGDADPERLLAAALPLVQNPTPAIASAAIEALGRLGGNAAEDGLFAALDHPDVEVVKLALVEIGRAPDARALARLGMSLDHTAPDVRKLAGELLGQTGGPAAQALLRARLVRERDAPVREALTSALMMRPHATEPSED